MHIKQQHEIEERDKEHQWKRKKIRKTSKKTKKTRKPREKYE